MTDFQKHKLLLESFKFDHKVDITLEWIKAISITLFLFILINGFAIIYNFVLGYLNIF